jgi:hypothetical protein
MWAVAVTSRPVTVRLGIRVSALVDLDEPTSYSI